MIQSNSRHRKTAETSAKERGERLAVEHPINSKWASFLAAVRSKNEENAGRLYKAPKGNLALLKRSRLASMSLPLRLIYRPVGTRSSKASGEQFQPQKKKTKPSFMSKKAPGPSSQTLQNQAHFSGYLEDEYVVRKRRDGPSHVDKPAAICEYCARCRRLGSNEKGYQLLFDVEPLKSAYICHTGKYSRDLPT